MQVLRRISKRPRTEDKGKSQQFESAREEWDDFLAPTCPMCCLGTDCGDCKCDELVSNAEAFLAPGGSGEDYSSASSDTTLQDGDQDDVFPQKMSP